MRRTGIALTVLLAGLRAGAAEGLPSRDPVAWQKEPHARTSSVVTMAAEPLGPAGTVEYLFDCVKGPGHDSGWQESPSYTDKGLEPLAACTYVAKARDRRRRNEIAPPSRPVEVTTRRAADHRNVKHGMIDRDLSSGKLEMIPLSITGDKDNRINIVVINRWVKGQRNAYNKPGLRDEFIKDARHVVRAFTAGDEKAIAPYPDYRGFFNIYAVWWPLMPPWNPQDRKGGMHWEDYKVIATGKDEVDVTFGALAEYELVFSLTDESTFVRHDPPHAQYPRAETRWKITNGAPSSTAAQLNVTLKGRDILFTKKIPTHINGVVNYPKDYKGPNSVTVRQTKTGQTIKATTSIPGTRVALHASKTYVCPEQFIEITVKPGQTKTWTRTHTFGKEAK